MTMGKPHSKHECLYVSCDVNQALDSSIWKGKTGFNVDNYNMDDVLSELSICLQESRSCPLRVDFPPHRLETETSKVLKLDHVSIGNHGSKEGCDKNKLNIEEFECGLQLDSSDNPKQEWAFTLYDFDGNGRITKEDLASLLKALYDAVGSSIKLPPHGAKTLKLRLSVGQEHTPHLQRMSKPKCPDRSKNTNKAAKNKVREFSKMNNLTRTQMKCTNERLDYPPAFTDRGTSSAPNQNLEDIKVHGQSSQLAAVNQMSVKHQQQLAAVNQMSVKNQQQLADLVQENMQRNQIRQLRRHHSDSRNESQHHHHKRRHRVTGTHCPVTTICAALSATMTSVLTEGGLTAATAGGGNPRTTEEPPDHRANESQDRRNYYLDLAGVENINSKFQNNPTVPLAGSGFVRTGGSHHRSRSHDISTVAKCDNSPVTDIKDVNQSLAKCDNARRETEQLSHRIAHSKPDIHHPSSKSFDPQEVAGQTQSLESPYHKARVAETFAGSKLGSFRPVGLPLPVSAHRHRRHRHREKDHHVAMQQVAQWIEREHTRDTSEEHVIIQRHEHHHIHEHHHHHHYHHYYEA